MSKEENELIIKAQKGDKTAFEQLIYQYDKNVLGIAYSFINNYDDANDIYQEVFLRVFKSIKKFEFRSEFSTWLYRITTNVCITFRSKRKKHEYTPIDDGFADGEGETRTLSEVIPGDERADTETLNTEIADKIDSGIKKLSPQQALVFTLKHYKGHKIKEIAAIMNCTEGTVKNYLFIATQKMREYLKRYYV